MIIVMAFVVSYTVVTNTIPVDFMQPITKNNCCCKLCTVISNKSHEICLLIHSLVVL